MMSGNFDGEPPEGVGADKWELARTFNAALAKGEAVRPGDMKGIEGLLQLSELQGMLSPFHVEVMAEAEAALTEFLGRHGY